MVTEPGAEMRVLTRQECLDLLADQEVGRIAVVLGRRPLIFPVNYVLDGDTIVFRTDPGTKLAAASSSTSPSRSTASTIAGAGASSSRASATT